MEKVSVVIPVYNVGEYLEECVDSIVKQTYSNLEIILIDDGSTDNSGQICEKLSHENENIVVVHQQNSGVSSARNCGIRIASGRYIMFLDGDDYVVHNIVENFVNEMKNFDLVMSGYIVFDKRGVISQVHYDDRKFLSLNTFAEQFYIYFPTIFNFVWGKLYNLDIIKKSNILFREDIMMGEDLIFNVDYYYYVNKIHILSDEYLYYRVVNGSLSKKHYSNVESMNKEYFGAAKKFMETQGCFDGKNLSKYYEVMQEDYLYALIILFQDSCIKHNEKKKEFDIICNSKMFLESISKIHISGFRNTVLIYCIQKKQFEIMYCSLKFYFLVKRFLKKFFGERDYEY